MAAPRPADVFLLSYPRTLSNLLSQLLSDQQPAWQPLSYPLHDAFVYAQTNLNDNGDDTGAPRPPPEEETLRTYLQALREGYQGLLESRNEAHQKGRAFFLKTHIVDISDPTLFHSDLRRTTTSSPPNFTVDSAAAALSPSPSPSSLRTNPTLLPDALLLSFTPVFLIRHPVLVVDSFWRAKALTRAADLRRGPGITAPHATGPRLTRALYEWFLLHHRHRCTADEAPDRRPPSPAIVLDADDVLEGDAVERLAAALGMDPARVVRRWEARSTEGLDEKRKRFVKDLWRSTGVDASRSARGLDVEAKLASWKDMYGEEAGQAMADLASSHMEDYLWLKSRKF